MELDDLLDDIDPPKTTIGSKQSALNKVGGRNPQSFHADNDLDDEDDFVWADPGK